MNTDEHRLRWKAREYEHVERPRDWYWALSIVASSLALVSVFFNDYFFAIIILVSAGTFALLAHHPSPLVDIELLERGIMIDGSLYLFEDIVAFWITYEEPVPLLLIDTTKIWSPNIVIPLVDVDPDEVQEFLAERSEERPMKEPIQYKLIAMLGL